MNNEIYHSKKFDKIFSELSVRFIRVSPKDIDTEIEYGLKKIQEFFEVDRVALTQFYPDKTRVKLVQAILTVKGDKLPEQIEVKKQFPWSLNKSLNGEVILFSSPDELPTEAATDKESYRELEVTSLLSIPLFIGGEVNFSISIVMTSSKRSWPKEFILQLREFGEIFVNAHLRKQSETTTQGSNDTLQVIVDHVPAFIAFIGKDYRYKFVNKQYEITFKKTREEIVGKHIKEVIGEELFDDVKQDLQKVFSGKTITRENKITTLPGSPRYSLVKAVPAYNSDEEVIGFYLLTIEISELKKVEVALRMANDEIKQLNKKLRNENIYLKDQIKLDNHFTDIIGKSESIQKVLFQVDQVSETSSTVLLQGETGVGKELIAREIHNRSKRKERTLVKVNCGALQANLIESELFGREKGAYTGADTRQIGRFEIADGSTIFLDEIAEMPMDLQVKLLRVLEEGEFERLGSSKTLKVDIRIIAATNRDLTKAVQEGKFREDLYYRIKVFPITVPPLRERIEDIPLLVEFMVEKLCRKMDKNINSIPVSSMEILKSYSWPGNIRELRNIIERSLILSQGNSLHVILPEITDDLNDVTQSLEDVERTHILSVLEKTNWKVKGENGAAEILGLNSSTLSSKMKKIGIARSDAP